MNLWCVNILGPDDVLAMPDWWAALEEANALNRYFARLDETRHESDPIMRAVVVPWPHSAESHAEDLVKQAERKAATQNSGSAGNAGVQPSHSCMAKLSGNEALDVLRAVFDDVAANTAERRELTRCFTDQWAKTVARNAGVPSHVEVADGTRNEGDK